MARGYTHKTARGRPSAGKKTGRVEKIGAVTLTASRSKPQAAGPITGPVRIGTSAGRRRSELVTTAMFYSHARKSFRIDARQDGDESVVLCSVVRDCIAIEKGTKKAKTLTEWCDMVRTTAMRLPPVEQGSRRWLILTGRAMEEL